VPGTRTIVVGNVLDEDAIEVTPLPGGRAVGFIGAYGYPPNLAAARHLALEVFPRLRELLPDAQLLLAGGGMEPETRAELAAVLGVEVLGRVRDSGAFMTSCSAMAFPLFFKSGPPLKVVEALARGRPMVTSPQIADALELTDGREVLVARRPQDAAAALARLLTDSGLAAALTAEGRRVFDARFSVGSAMAEARRHSVLAHVQRPHEMDA
jgi:glycosyltransferase involved in cell wall biosynthesis